MSKFHYIRRKKDGKVLDIPDRDKERTLKTGDFDYIGEVGVQNTEEAHVAKTTEAEVVSKDDKDEPKGFQCVLCEYVGKTERGLKVHKTRKHD